MNHFSFYFNQEINMAEESLLRVLSLYAKSSIYKFYPFI